MSYNGRLVVHSDLIIHLNKVGFPPKKIASYLHHVKGVPYNEFNDPNGSPMSLINLVNYAIRALGQQPATTKKQRPTYYDLVPNQVASAQTNWERRRLVHRMFAAGLHWSEISKKLGLSRTRIYQMYRTSLKTSPIEKYLSRPPQLGRIGPLGKRAIYSLAQRPTSSARDWLIL